MHKVLRCYAEGRDGDWEAICLDLDIAVQGQSFKQVSKSLVEAIELHISTVMTLPESERRHLLYRPAPFSIRLKFLLYALRSLFTRRDGSGLRHQFEVPCPA